MEDLPLSIDSVPVPFRLPTGIPVLRIRDVYPGSRIQLFSIPDPNCLHPGSASKNFSVLTQKKWFLSSRKYDPGCLSWVPDPDADFYPSRIPDPGVKKAPDPGSRIRIRNTAVYSLRRQVNISCKKPPFFSSKLLFCPQVRRYRALWLREESKPCIEHVHFRYTKLRMRRRRMRKRMRGRRWAGCSAWCARKRWRGRSITSSLME
jgi:hypothetical protein